MKPNLAGRFFFAALAILWAAVLLLPVSSAAAARYSSTLVSDKMTGQPSGTKLNRFSHLVGEEEVFPSYTLWLYRGWTKTAIPCDSSVNFLLLGD